MCAQFLIKSRVDELVKKYGIKLPIPYTETDAFDERVLPYRKAPVIKLENGEIKIKPMSFSLVPSWSKEPKVKFATHNARIETIAEKPTWKKPFQSKRCLIPLTHFIEPIYLNQYAGNMVQFYEKAGSVLTAAGIFDEWVNKETGEVLESFSIITDEPPQFIAAIGHDRCPVFLKDSAFHKWLDPGSKDPKSLLALLKSERQELDLTVGIDRPLAKGWEKRIPV